MNEHGPDETLARAAEEAPARPTPGEPSAHAFRVIVGVGVTAIVIFLIGIAAAGLLQVRVAGWLHPPQTLPDALVVRPEVGPVDKLPFEVEKELSQRDRQRARLESYGWVDRERGVAHVPIEVAMDELVREGGR